MGKLVERLHVFHKKQGIAAEDFHCRYYSSCKSGYINFTEAKGTFVSSGYESSLPRLLFISLDPGREDFYRLPKNRTLLNVQKHEMERDITALPKNRHWYRTVELASSILKIFKEYQDLQINQATQYFAHINTVKCCVNNPGNKKANNRLFRNCQSFVPHEVEVLKPNIIVTQGEEAKHSIENCFRAYDNPNYLSIIAALPELSVLIIKRHPVLWIHTYHPSCWGSFNRQRRERVVSFLKASKNFIELLRTDSKIKYPLETIASDFQNKIDKEDNVSTFAEGLKIVTDKLRSLGAENVKLIKEGMRKRLNVSNSDGTRTIYISTRTKKKGTWQTSTDYGSPQNEPLNEIHYWVFVDLTTTPQFYIVPEWWISNDIYNVYHEYLSKHGVRPKNPNSKHHGITLDRIKQWHNRWDRLRIF